MAFDLATARPIAPASGGFDLSTARPVGTAGTSSRGGSFLQGLEAPFQAAASLATGALAPAAAAAENLATGHTSPTDYAKAKQAWTYSPSNPIAKADINALTYIPSHTIGKVVGWLGNHIERASGGRMSSEQAQDAINTALMALPLKAASAPARAVEVSDAVRQAHDMNFVVKPSQAGRAPLGTFAEGATSSPRLSNEASFRNAPVATAHVAEQVGLPRATKITGAQLERARAPHTATYDEMGTLGEVKADATYDNAIANIGRRPGTSFPGAASKGVEDAKEAFSVDRFNAADAVQATRKLRADASKNIKAPNDPERNDLGYAQRQISDALEAQMERAAKAAGKGDLVKRFQSARKKLAQIHSVEDALGENGHVSAQQLAKQLDRGVPLSGAMLKIAKLAKQFPDAFRDTAKIKNRTPYGALTLGGAAFELGRALEHPKEAAIVGAALASPPLIRKGLLSAPYQRSLSKGGTTAASQLQPLLLPGATTLQQRQGQQ